MTNMIAAVAVGMFGRADALIKGFLVFMVIDYITGVLCACVKKSPKTGSGGLSSSAGLSGILKKGAMLLAVIFGQQLDRMTGAGICRDAVLAMLAFNEGVSILENLGHMGIKMPEIVLKVLDKVGGEKDEKNATGMQLYPRESGTEDRHDNDSSHGGESDTESVPRSF